MGVLGECCVFEQALPPPNRTIQVSRDEADPLSISQSFIEATVRTGSLCGCTHLQGQDKLLCWELDPSIRCLTVREVIANAEQQPEACQWVFTFELLPAVCSYTSGQTVTLVLFSQAGSLLQLAINTSHPRGCLYDPRETTDRIQYPLSQVLPGKVTAMEICNGMLCLACNSTETPLVALRLDDLSKARLMPLREGKSVMQWVSGILGTSQPPCVACMVNVPVSGACNALAVLYTSGLLSMWEPSNGRHLCQMAVGAAAQPQQDGNAQPFTVSGLATCGWPSAQSGKALLIVQVDQLSGVRSTSSTLSIISLHLTHSGRVGEVSAMCTLDMLDVAAVTSSPGSREDLLVPNHQGPGSSHDTEYVGQLVSAAVIDAEASLVSVLMHCDTMTRMFVVNVDTNNQEATVVSSVLGLESSLEEQLFMDVSHAPVHEALHQQAGSLLSSTSSSSGDAAALECILPGLVSASHVNHDALALALMHIGSSATATALQSSDRTAILRTLRSAITSAAQQRGLSPLTVAAQLGQRYLTLCASESAAIGLFDAPCGSTAANAAAGGSSTPSYLYMGALSAPVVLRRGLGIATLRSILHPGVKMLQCVRLAMDDRQRHMRALLQETAAVAGPVMLKWPWAMVPSSDVQLSAACTAVAQAVVVGVPSGPFPTSSSLQQAQVDWRERRRKLLLQMQAHVAHIGCMDVLQELEASLDALHNGPSHHCAASAAHACSAVEAVSDMDARYTYTVVFLLHLVVAVGSMDGTPLQTHHYEMIRRLMGRFQEQAASAATVRFLNDMWGGTASSAPNLENLQISDQHSAVLPVGTSSPVASAGGRTSLLRILAKPDASEMYQVVSGADATKVVLQLIKHGVLWPLEELSRLLAARAVAANAIAGTGQDAPSALFTRGICMLGALSASETAPGEIPKVTAAAVSVLCSALDQALLMNAMHSSDMQASGMFQNMVAILYKQLCCMDAPELNASAVAFEVAYYEMLARLSADKMGNPAAAAALAQVGLQRAQSKHEQNRATLLPQQLRQAAVRMQICVYSYLCDAGDWDGAYAAVMSDRSSETAENICGLVRRAVEARKLRMLLTWSFPGVIQTHVPRDGVDGPTPEEDSWVHVQPCLQIALEQLKRCTHSRQHSPDLELCKIVYGHCIASGDKHGAAETMLQYAAHAHERPSSFPDAEVAVQGVLTALCFAAMALKSVPSSNAWVRNVVGAVVGRGRWRGDVLQPDGLFSPRDDSHRSTQGAELVLTMSDITAECGRLRAVLSIVDAARKGARGVPSMSAGRALQLSQGTVFAYLLQLRLFVEAAEFARSAALHNCFLVHALREVASAMGRACAEAHREGMLGLASMHASTDARSALTWPGLDLGLSTMESLEWLQGANLEDGKSASLEPPGCLRAAAAQAVLEIKTGLELPSFLLVSFMPVMKVNVQEHNVRSRIVCAVSAAAILRALVAAGKTKMAASMVEDDLLEWQRASPLDRQKAGSFWMPWTSVTALLQQLRVHGHASNAANLEDILASHTNIVKADSKAVVVDGQRQISAL